MLNLQVPPQLQLHEENNYNQRYPKFKGQGKKINPSEETFT